MKELTPEGAAKAATGSFIAAGLYAVCMILCAIRFAFIVIMRKRAGGVNYQRVN